MAPTEIPKVVPDKGFNVGAAETVQAVATPDNYLAAAEVLLAAATRSIDVEQLFIRPSQPEVGRLLAAMKSAQAQRPSLTGSASRPAPRRDARICKGARPARHRGAEIGIARYVTALVDLEWKTSVKTFPKAEAVKPEELGPIGIRVRYGDYADV
jgi:hypothetical protein